MILEDVQNHEDDRGIPIDQVGVADLRCPIVVFDQKQEKQQTVANIQMSVSLPHHFKGTHMSRFIEVLNEHRGEMTMRTLPEMLHKLRERLVAENARIEITFPYFINREAPVTGAQGLMDYECTFIGDASPNEDDFVLGVRVPVNSLCPCSKSISDYGGHNQRGYVTIQVRSSRGPGGEPLFIWIEELIALAETSASAPIYPLLKREDERHVTMQSYDNPVFVEDIVRAVATQLQSDDRVAWFKVHVQNFESIHNHSAFAALEWTRNSDDKYSTP